MNGKSGMLVLALVLLSMTACVVNYTDSDYNPYKKFYKGMSRTEVEADSSLIISGAELLLLEGKDIQKDSEWYLSNGYKNIGITSFEDDQTDLKYAMEYAKSLHATMILVYRQYSRTKAGSVTYFPLSFMGITQDNSVDRFNFIVTYWIKAKPPIFGAGLIDLTQEQKLKIQSNKGAFLSYIVKGSPAYNANIIPGDIVLRINDNEILDMVDLQNTIDRLAGTQVTVTLFREGRILQIPVQLSNRM